MKFVAPFVAAYLAIATKITTIAGWWGETDYTIHLMKNNPSIDSNTVVGAFVEADFSGYAALDTGYAAEVRGDPLTGLQVMRIIPAEGGLQWLLTGPTNLPQTIYGAYILNSGEDKILGAIKFPTPIVLNSADQYIDLGEIRFFVNLTPLGG